MSTSLTGIPSTSDRCGWQSEFVRILPKVRRLARVAFRACRAELREELVAEVTADTCIWFRRLCELGRRHDAHPSVLVRYSVKRIGSGVRVGSPQNRYDVSSRICELCFGVRRQSLQVHDGDSGGWRDMLLECRQSSPADLAASRIDFQTWLGTLSSRDREIALMLATGEETRRVAAHFGLTNGRISQKRREFAVRWFALHGLDANGRENSAVAA